MTKRQMELEQAKKRLFLRVSIEKQGEKVKAEQKRLRDMRQDLRNMRK